MELNETVLEEIVRLAACAFHPKEVAFVLGIKPSEMMAQMMNEDSDVSIAYFKGLYTSEMSIRESNNTLARNGSSPAITTANKIFDENRLKLIQSGISPVDEA
jgi:hypothetical protein